jgi:hypothetical protein
MLLLGGIPRYDPSSLVKVKVKVKQSLYRPGQAFKASGRSSSQNF